MNAALEAQEQSANKNATPEVDDDMFSAALDFNRIRVGEFMVPRTEIVSFPAEGSVTDLRALFVETNLSRIVITRDSLDDLVGLVHTSSLLDADPLPQTLVSLIQPLMVVPETLPANRLLGEFNRARRSIAAVVDEFGGTAGLVTLEDLVEVIIGEIEDEYDEPVDPSRIEERLGPGTYRLSARLEVEYLNRQYELGIPEGEYSTLGGYLLHLAERIPEPNEVFLTSELKLTVLATHPNRIEQLRVERRDLSAEAPSSL
jgi:CBS domain containing-hemolysin-like protein